MSEDPINRNMKKDIFISILFFLFFDRTFFGLK